MKKYPEIWLLLICIFRVESFIKPTVSCNQEYLAKKESMML